MSESFYPIYDWMTEEQHLGGLPLLVYSLIYSFTVSCGKFSGSAQYLSKRTGLARRTVMRQLRTLTEQGLLLKEDVVSNGVKYCNYRAAVVRTEEKPLPAADPAPFPVSECHSSHDAPSYPPVTEGHTPHDAPSYPPVTEGHTPHDAPSYPPVTEGHTPYDAPSYHKKEHNKTSHIKEDKVEKDAPPRRQYGEYQNVLLTDGELEQLRREYPDDWQRKLEHLSGYMASTGRTYQNHLATIRLWAKKDAPPEKPKGRFDDLKGGLVL